ncbi:MAG: DUF1134 domain-containing protein [Hyphomicrobiaceae bacterium]
MPSSIMIKRFVIQLRRTRLISAALFAVVFAAPAFAQETLPWQRQAQSQVNDYDSNSDAGRYSPPEAPLPPVYDGYGSGSTYNDGPEVRNPPQYRNRGNIDPEPSRDRARRVAPPSDDRYGQPYDAPRRSARGKNGQYERYDEGPNSDAEIYGGPPPEQPNSGYYSQGEITRAGHRFFGSVSSGLASVIEYAFKRSGRPNGYILGEDAGGALVAGLRYGEGTLHTRRFGRRKVFWQGPSIGYDFGAAGSKTMVLVYNLNDPSQIFHRFGGVEGSAYFVGGVSIQFQQYGNVILAPIRSGVGLRLGANVGYLKYTRRPTWNPF